MTENLRNRRSIALIGAVSLIGTVGVNRLLVTAGVSEKGAIIWSIAAFFALAAITAVCIQKYDGFRVRDNKRTFWFATVIGWLFSVTMFAGYQLQLTGMTEGGVKGKGKIVLFSLCLATAVYPIIYAFFNGIKTAHQNDRKDAFVSTGKSWLVFGCSAIAIFALLIPVWLAYYPIIMSYDFHRQINEAVNGLAYFYPLQPIAHTYIIRCFLLLGYKLGSVESGMAAMAVSQMILYSLVTGYACAMTVRLTGKLRYAIIGGVFFGLFPYNTVLVVCTTKDTLFSILFLLFFLLLTERLYFSEGRVRQAVFSALILLEGIVMMQFRNNAVYAVAVFVLVMLLAVPLREKWKVLVIGGLLLVCSVQAGKMIKTAIGTQINLDQREKYSVPMQQFARVGKLHGASLKESSAEEDVVTVAILDFYVPEAIWDAYNPSISDAVKANVDVTHYYENKSLPGDWLYMAKRYPNEFLDAFLELTRGYWFLGDTSFSDYLGTENRYGTIFTYNSSSTADFEEIKHETRAPKTEAVLEHIVTDNAYRNWPVISLLFQLPLYCWCMVLLIALAWYLKKGKQFLMFVLPLMYFGTMLLGPVAQVRYMTPIMWILPVMAGTLAIKNQSRKE